MLRNGGYANLNSCRQLKSVQKNPLPEAISVQSIVNSCKSLVLLASILPQESFKIKETGRTLTPSFGGSNPPSPGRKKHFLKNL